MSQVMKKKTDFRLCKNKDTVQLAVSAQLISIFVFAVSWIVQLLLNLYPKFQDSSFLLWVYRTVCVRPGWKSQRLFSHVTAHMKSDKTNLIAISFWLYIGHSKSNAICSIYLCNFI